MAIRRLDNPPKTEDFTPLQEHQEQTPTSFFGSKPILYVHQDLITLSIPASQLEKDSTFARFSVELEGDEALVKHVLNEHRDLMIFQNSSSPIGVAIPYPSVALHATMKYKSTIEALYMNISLNDAETVNDEEEIQVLEVTILPPSYSSNPDTACVQEIFSAMNTCADLHPDLNASDDDQDLLDETAPGATGWITADNMTEFMDENGNFCGTVLNEEALGPGAGTVRQRDENEVANGIEGEDEHGDKYHRTG